MNKRTLADVADCIRTKNAGPFSLTIDIIFKDKETYDLVKKDKSITPEVIAEKYGIGKDQIQVFEYVDWISALKITMRRQWVSGDPGEPDVYGCQQHAPLLDIII